jgi:hypothetical protein
MDFPAFIESLKTDNNQSLVEAIQQGYQIIFESEDPTPAKFHGKEFWIGSVSTLDGAIEEVHSYQKAASNDFHHSVYFSQGSIDKMASGESAVFWVNEKGIIQSQWRDDELPADIIAKIKEQIELPVK